MRQRLGDEARTGVLNTARARSRGGMAPANGFTLVELMVTITLLAILLMLAAPSMLDWVRNSKIRAVAEALQSGLREAQSESLRRSRQVVFALTDDKPTAASANFAAKDNGNNWTLRTLPSMASDESSVFVSAGILTDVGSGVTIEGPAAVCFNSVGRLTANTTTNLTNVTGGETCSADAATYDIKLPNADRPLRVLVTLGGQVRMCDPNKTMSDSNPDGCPAT